MKRLGKADDVVMGNVSRCDFTPGRRAEFVIRLGLSNVRFRNAATRSGPAEIHPWLPEGTQMSMSASEK
jgi:hypothetical protein